MRAETCENCGGGLLVRQITYMCPWHLANGFTPLILTTVDMTKSGNVACVDCLNVQQGET